MKWVTVVNVLPVKDERNRVPRGEGTRHTGRVVPRDVVSAVAAGYVRKTPGGGPIFHRVVFN